MEKIIPSSGLWYAEREERGHCWNFYGRQEDRTFGLVQNGLQIEDILPFIEEEAEWILDDTVFLICRLNEGVE